MATGAHMRMNTDTPPMRIEAALILSQWFSPAYPVGGFAYSHGLETAVQAFGKAEDTAKQEAAGQLLFAAVNAARLAGVDAEEALTFASKRFAQQCLEQEQSGTQVE